MSRIQLKDSVMDMLIKMAEGNPGAIDAMMNLMQAGPVVDPQSVIPEIMPILLLDTHKIYGSNIYILFSDKCKKDTRKFLVLLRAVQLGLMSGRKLQEIAYDQSRSVNLTDEEFNKIDSEVCDQLEEFQRPSKAE